MWLIFVKNDTIQIKDMVQIVATWLQFSTEEYAFITLVPAWGQAEVVGFCCQPFLTEEPPGPTREQMSWNQAQLCWEEALLLLPWLSGD